MAVGCEFMVLIWHSINQTIYRVRFNINHCDAGVIYIDSMSNQGYNLSSNINNSMHFNQHQTSFLQNKDN